MEAIYMKIKIRPTKISPFSMLLIQTNSYHPTLNMAKTSLYKGIETSVGYA